MSDLKSPVNPGLVNVNVEEGFYPRFCIPFLDHYGPDSVFVRAVADCFSSALARLLEARGMLLPGTKAPVLGMEEARRAVTGMIRAAPSLREILLRESFGVVPPGAWGTEIDQTAGKPVFARWLAALEAGDYNSAGRLIPAPDFSEACEPEITNI